MDPFLDQKEILRVGGRLHRADLSYEERHPIILPKEHHITKLLIRQHHQNIYHQGRVITHGAIRGAGYWIVGGHRLVSKILNSCVTCRKLRGDHSINKWLTYRLTELKFAHPSRTSVWTYLVHGLSEQENLEAVHQNQNDGDSCSHFSVAEPSISKYFSEWTQAHSSMPFAAFFAIRGPATLLRSDCGTNFTEANTELGKALKEMDRAKVEKYIKEQGCHWKFNPPHASHFGGVWERQIGTIRRVLDAMLLNIARSQLDHELLITCCWSRY